MVKTTGGKTEHRNLVHVASYECEECGHVGRIEHTSYEDPLVIARRVSDDHRAASPSCPRYQNSPGERFPVVETRHRSPVKQTPQILLKEKAAGR